MDDQRDESIRPMRPVDFAVGPQSLAGRSVAIGVGLLSSFVSLFAIAAWIRDLGRQLSCGPQEPPLFDIPRVGIGIAVSLLLGAISVVVVSLWRKPHRVAATVGGGILVIAFLWVLAGAAFYNGNVSNCFPTF
jgi:hypothetical protein